MDLTEQLHPAIVRPDPAALELALPAARLVSAFLAGRSPRTLRAYRGDLEDFSRWSGAGSAEEAARLLLAADHGAANEAALRYRADLVERGLSPAMVNRRLAALRQCCRNSSPERDKTPNVVRRSRGRKSLPAARGP